MARLSPTSTRARAGLDDRPGLGALHRLSSTPSGRRCSSDRRSSCPAAHATSSWPACATLPITAEGIPDFRRLSDVLMQRTRAGRWSPFLASSPTKCSSSISRIAAFPPAISFASRPARLPRRARRLPRRVRPRADAHEPGDRRLHPGVRRRRAARAEARRAAAACARVLVHGRVRAGRAARRAAHLWLGHRVVVHRKRVRARR